MKNYTIFSWNLSLFILKETYEQFELLFSGSFYEESLVALEAETS